MRPPLRNLWRGAKAALLLGVLAAPPATAQFGGAASDAPDARLPALGAESRSVAPVAGPVDAATYIVGPGDILRIVFSGPFVQERTVEIGPEGTVLVPDHGPIRIGGMTLEQARAEIRRRIGAGMRHDVRVDVELARVRLLHVFLTGDVTVLGPIELPATARASDALQGGSAIAATGSRRNVEVRHLDGSVERADIERLTRLGDGRLNPMVRDNDVLFVPPAREWTYVGGAVAHEARFELAPGDSLGTLVQMAGGPLASARHERTLFVRWNSPASSDSSWVNLDDILAGRYSPPLRDGDRLLVYHLSEFHRFEAATIFGEVTSPGVYPLAPGATRLSDLVRAAGGFQPRADLSGIHVYRPRPNAPDQDSEIDRLSRLSRNEMTTSEYEVLRTRLIQRRPDFRVDWNRLLRTPDTDILLVDGDVVRVDPVVATVRVEGQVKHPGLVRFDPGAGISRYVENAGGFSGRAAGGQTLVTRAVTGQTLRAREVSSIEPGDLIWVPERPDRSIWQNLGTLIAISAQVATLIIAVRR